MQAIDYPQVWLGSDGVMRIDYGQGALITLDAIRTACARMEALSSTPHPILILGRGAMNTTLEAEEFAAGPIASGLALAVGRLMESNAARVVSNLYQGLSPLPYPVRAFVSEEEAVVWLRGFVPAG